MSIECYLLQTASPEGSVPSVFVHEHEEEMKERVGRQWVIDGESFQYILPCLPSVILIEIEITTSLPTAVSVKYQLSRGPILYTVFASLANILPKSNDRPLPASLHKSPHFTRKHCKSE